MLLHRLRRDAPTHVLFRSQFKDWSQHFVERWNRHYSAPGPLTVGTSLRASWAALSIVARIPYYGPARDEHTNDHRLIGSGLLIAIHKSVRICASRVGFANRSCRSLAAPLTPPKGVQMDRCDSSSRRLVADDDLILCAGLSLEIFNTWPRR